MNRRRAITLLGGAAAAWPLAARAQHPATPVIGFLNSGSAREWAHLVAAFREGLNELGLIEGKNVAVEYRWAHGENERLAHLAADLVDRRVVVIVAFGPPAALAAKAATTTIPVVFMAGTDPIDLGLVTNFRHPTGNLTGLNVFAEVLTPKRQELLHELVPSAQLVAMLVDPTAVQTRSELPVVQAAADRIGQQVRIFNASSDREIDAALATIVDQRIGGLNRPVLYASARSACIADHTPRDPDDFWMARIRRGWRSNELRDEPTRRLSSAGCLHGTNS